MKFSTKIVWIKSLNTLVLPIFKPCVDLMTLLTFDSFFQSNDLLIN